MARMAAGVRKRSDGTLEKRFSVDGRRYSVYAATTKEITRKEQELREQIQAGTYTRNSNITLDKYFYEHMKRKQGNIKGSTYAAHVNYYKNQISPVLGSTKVRNIERRQIYELRERLKKNLAPSTGALVISILKECLYSAIKDEIIIKNPADGISITVEYKTAETAHRALTEEEQKEFMNVLKGNYYYEFIALMLCTGMRQGETAALTWKDIDYKKNVIHVKRTITKTENGKTTTGTPKTKTSTRDIPINNSIRDILAMQKEKTKIVPIHNGQYVFVTPRGEIVSNIVTNRAIKQTLSQLEQQGKHIEPFTSHALRDTFATRFIEQGGNPQTLKTILGHSSLSMTMDLYAHVLPNTKQQEMDNLKIVL